MLDLYDAKSDHDEGIPAGLDEMEPGPILAAFLASIDVTRVSGYDRIVVLRAHQRLVSHYTASLYADMAAVVDVLDDAETKRCDAAEAAAAEVRAALHLTRRSADNEISIALELATRLPQIRDMLAAGVLDLRRARVLLDGTSHLDDDIARRVVDQIADDATRYTTGQLRARLRRLCIEAEPDDAPQRYQDAVTERRVAVEANDSGTANLLGMDLPPDRATAAAQRINHIARSLRHAGEDRSIDQLRADVYLDLLCGTNHDKTSRGVVDLRVNIDTLTELNNHPGDLAGYGPVIADIARNVAKHQTDAEWRYTITNPDTGQPVTTGVTRRRPTASQRRAVEARNPTCVFPGCRMPATNSDLDHRVRYSDGGATTEDNLGPLCRHDHCIRHQHGWTYTPLPNGNHQWTSRLGHTYTTSGTPP
jgi:hypothetical protein